MTRQSSTRRLGLGLSFLALMGGCGAAGTPPPGPGGTSAPGPAVVHDGCTAPVTPRALGRGMLSGVTDARIELVRSQSAWASLWALHEPGASPPAVDFASEQVLAVVRQRTTGGFTLEIAEVCLEGDGLTVRVVEHAPGPDEATIQILTQPWICVALPRVAGQVKVQLVTREGSHPNPTR